MSNINIEKAFSSLEATIHKVAQSFDNGGGIKAIAKRLNLKSENSLSNKCNPTNDAKLNLKDLVGILSVLDDDERKLILIEINRWFDHTPWPIKKLNIMNDDDLLDSWAAWDAERGETAIKIKQALQDKDKRTSKKISSNEYNSIKHEMLEDIQKELELLRRLEAI